MNTSNLKPCPFCGGPAAEFRWPGHYGCADGACGAYAANLTAEQWNTRAPVETSAPLLPVGGDSDKFVCPTCVGEGSVYAEQVKTKPAPPLNIAGWVQVVYGPWDMHPRRSYVDGSHRPKGEGWKPLYEEPDPPKCLCGCYSGGCCRPEGCLCDKNCPCQQVET